MDVPSKNDDGEEQNTTLKGEAHDFHQSIMQEIHATTSPSKISSDDNGVGSRSNDTIRNNKKKNHGGPEEVNEANSDDEMFDALPGDQTAATGHTIGGEQDRREPSNNGKIKNKTGGSRRYQKFRHRSRASKQSYFYSTK